MTTRERLVRLLADGDLHSGAAWAAQLADVGKLMNEILMRLDEAREARGQIEALMRDHPAVEHLQADGARAITRIGEWEALITQLKHETYEDEDAWESMLVAQLRYLIDVIDETGAPVTQGAMDRYKHLRAEWAVRQRELADITAKEIAPINAWARAAGVEHVRTPGD